jgi:hypothetical protein
MLERRLSSSPVIAAKTTPNIAEAESVVARAWKDGSSSASSPTMRSRKSSRLSVNQPVMSDDFVAESIVARAWQRAEAAAAQDEDDGAAERQVWEEHHLSFPYNVRTPKLGITIAVGRTRGPNGEYGVEVSHVHVGGQGGGRGAPRCVCLLMSNASLRLPTDRQSDERAGSRQAWRPSARRCLTAGVPVLEIQLAAKKMMQSACLNPLPLFILFKINGRDVTRMGYNGVGGVLNEADRNRTLNV